MPEMATSHAMHFCHMEAILQKQTKRDVENRGGGLPCLSRALIDMDPHILAGEGSKATSDLFK